MKRSKSYFCHNAVNFYPIGMQLMPKCSEFNARSSDIRHDPVTSLPLLAVGGQRSGGSRPCKMCGFCHNSVNSYPICMKSAPNCSLFCSPHSYAKYRTVAAAKVCALPSARSSYLRKIFCGRLCFDLCVFIYLFICLSVIRITQKVFNRIAWNLVGWLVMIQGPFD